MTALDQGIDITLPDRSTRFFRGYCVEDNDHGIEDNDDHIYRNSQWINAVNDEIDK